MRVWIKRFAALLALVGAAAGVLLAIGTVGTIGESAGGPSPAEAMVELNRANAMLSGRLEALEAGASPQEALAAARAATDLARRLVGDVEDPAVEGALRSELEYLDAVGSTLNNPRSALRGRVGVRGNALRDALRQVPGGDHRVVSGGQELVAYSEARAGER